MLNSKNCRARSLVKGLLKANSRIISENASLVPRRDWHCLFSVAGCREETFGCHQLEVVSVYVFFSVLPPTIGE